VVFTGGFGKSMVIGVVFLWCDRGDLCG